MSSDLRQPLAPGDRLTPSDLKVLPVPESQRKFADLPCCLLFALFWVGMIVVGGYALTSAGGLQGYKALTNGIQFDGEVCGLGSLANEEYLYWPKPADSMTFSVCVASCPTAAGDTITVNLKTSNGSTATQQYQSYATHAVYHYCLPEDSAGTTIVNAVNSKFKSGSFGRMMSDLGKSAGALAAAAFIAMAAGFIYMWLLWFLGPCLVYSSIVVFIIVCGVAGYLVYSHARGMPSGDEKAVLSIVGIALWVVDVLFILVIIAVRKSISVAVTCLKEATLAIRSMKRILLLPLVKFVLLFILAIWFVLVAVYLASSGTWKQTTVTVPGTGLDVPFKTVEFNNTLRYMGLYHFFGLLWTVSFILAVADIIIAGSVGHWYFTPLENGEKNVQSPIAKSIGNALKRQLGAAAFGSLVLAIVMFVKWALRYAHKKLHDAGADRSALVKFAMCMCMCCVHCFECCVKFLDRQAYIHMALFGGGFCASARAAFSLIARNAIRLAGITMIGSLFSILGIGLVVAITAVATYFIVTSSAYTGVEGLSSPALPVIFSIIISYAIASVFMTVLDMAINTILHCFVADEEANDGHPQFLGADSDLPAVARKKKN